MQNKPKVKVFVEGRYRKLTRDLPQTVYFCPECKGHFRRRKKCERCEGFGKLSRDSVQELVGWVLGKAFGTRKNKFHGSGREDVDVRMLGRGRPFVMEFLDPKEPEIDLAELEAEVNRRNEGRLEIEGLCWSDQTRVRELKETPHAKDYQVRVRSVEPLDLDACMAHSGARIQVEQRTPNRVAHRRADKTRERWIEICEITPFEGAELEYLVRLRTEHGTYVKEVVTGEDGRSEPSLSELFGVSCECVELDVLNILSSEGEQISEPERPLPFGHIS
jgi:tRNA pseudouridine synthase 10